MKGFLLKLPVELHTKIKVLTATKSVTMSDFIIEAIQEKLKKESK